MYTDDLIIDALSSPSIPGEGLFVVEGNPKRDVRVLPADKAFTDNLECFRWNINTGYSYLGLFADEKHAATYIKYILENAREELTEQLLFGDTDRLITNALTESLIPAQGHFLLEGNPQQNILRIIPTDEAFQHNLNSYIRNLETGFQYMGVFTEEQFAQTIIHNIRHRLRNEQGERLQ